MLNPITRGFNASICSSVLLLPLLLTGMLIFSGCTTEHPDRQAKLAGPLKEKASSNPVHKEVGEASWYGKGFQGQETANGETFDQKEMTAAHPSLPMGTKAKVTNLENGKKVDVRINDRGPFVGARVIDLSRAAAKKIDMETDGTTQVKIETKPIKKNTAVRSRHAKKSVKKPQ